MKILIASDLHGSAIATRKIIELSQSLGAQKVILLGDVYNHGPRNALPDGYAPMEVAEILNANLDKLTVIKGNCDSAVDTMISSFDFLDTSTLIVEDKTLVLTHGHVYNMENPPKGCFDALIYGHFHTGFIKNKDGRLFVNVGSVSLPKNGTPKSLLLVDGKSLSLITLEGEIIESASL